MYTEDSVIFNAPSIVNTTYVIYNMEPVLLVIQGGQEQGVQKSVETDGLEKTAQSHVQATVKRTLLVTT